MQIDICATTAEAGARAARLIADRLQIAVAERGVAALALSGGRTPAVMYAPLASARIAWAKIHLFQVDERLVSEDDERSNMKAIRAAFEGVVAAGQIHAMPVTSASPARAAARYARELAAVAGTPAVLDVVHLGLGADGHTASLFAKDAAVDANGEVTLTGRHDGLRRMSLTLEALNRARSRIWLVTGRSKRDMVSRLLAGDQGLVASRIRREDSILVLDHAAAAERP